MSAKSRSTPSARRRHSDVKAAMSPLACEPEPCSDTVQLLGKPLQPLAFSEPALAAAKWLALLLMVIDHANKYLFDGSVGWMYAVGRLSMPLFAFVVGMNLARIDMRHHGRYRRTAMRLAVFGVLATPAFIALNHLPAGWWPLNMMFGLLVAVIAAWLMDRRDSMSRMSAWVVVVWGGALVEFWWPAVGLCLCVWAYQRRPLRALLFGYLSCLGLLWFVNGNFWALAVVPLLVALARWWRWPLPRAQWFFYCFYPLHLCCFWLVQALF